MEKIVFEIPYPRNKSAFCKRFGLNAYWSGKHWGQRKADAEYIHQLVHVVLRSGKVPRQVFQNPVRITFAYNDGLDVDNHAAIEKMIVDALRGWVLTNDSKRYYAERRSKFHDDEALGILVTVEEV